MERTAARQGEWPNLAVKSRPTCRLGCNSSLLVMMTAVVVPRSTDLVRGGRDVVAAEPWSMEVNWNWNEIMSREWTSCGRWILGYGAWLSYRIVSTMFTVNIYQWIRRFSFVIKSWRWWLAGVSNIDEEEEYLRNGAQVLWKQLHPPGDKNESLFIERIFFFRWIDTHTLQISRVDR